MGSDTSQAFRLLPPPPPLSLSLSLSLSVQAFADGLMVIPKTLAQNSGFDPQEISVKLQDAYVQSKQPVGLDVSTGEGLVPWKIQ